MEQATPPPAERKVLSHISLRKRFAVANIIVVITIITAFSIAAYFFSESKATARLKAKVDNISTIAAASLRSALWNLDKNTIQDIIDALLKEEGVTFFNLTDDANRFYRKTAAGFEKQGFGFFKNSSDFKTQITPVYNGGKKIGEIQLAISNASYKEQLRINTIGIILLIGAIILAISLSSLFMTVRYIFNPLKKLNQSVKAMAKTDNRQDGKIDEGGEDEFGDLAIAFEKMGKSIQQLVDSRENTIAERTSQLEKARDDAEKANKAKDVFLANVSHEIRTPMNSIVGFTDFLIDTELTKDQKNYLKRVNRSTQDLKRIIDDLLDHSKMASGTLNISDSPFYLPDILEDIAEDFKTKITAKGLTLPIRQDESVPNALKGDEQRLKQVLNNLIHNAIKFTEKGSVGLHISILETIGNVAKIRFEVSDTGCGIPSHESIRIFEPYEQLKNSPKEVAKGVGLGLTISKQLVGLMNGEIFVDSVVGKGSRFWFVIPFIISDEASVDRSVRLSAKAGQWETLQGVKVLVAEDDESSRELMKELLELGKMLFEIAENGQRAFEMVTNSSYDIVLLDMKLPVLNGYEVAEKIRQMERLKGLPIIAVTANAMIGEKQKCLDLGMTDYISKPISRDILFGTIKKHVTASNTEAMSIEEGSKMEPFPTLSEMDQKLIKLLEGVDFDDYFARTGLGLSTLIKSLRAFAHTNTETITDLKGALRRGDNESALVILHTLKGASANLSAKEVAADATHFHSILPESNGQNMPQLDKLEKSLNLVLNSFRSVDTAMHQDGLFTANQGVSIPPLEFKSRFTELLKSLKKHNYDSIELLAQILPHLSSLIPADERKKMDDNMKRVDYRAIISILNPYASGMGITI